MMNAKTLQLAAELNADLIAALMLHTMAAQKAGVTPEEMATAFMFAAKNFAENGSQNSSALIKQLSSEVTM